MKFSSEPIEGKICIVFYVLMTIVIGLQVFFRYVLGSSLVWSEELGRYLFIWAIYLGCGYAVVTDSHLSITMGRDLFPKKIQLVIAFVADIFVLIFCLIVAYFGSKTALLLIDTGQVTAGLGLVQGYLFLALPIGMLFMGFRKTFVMKAKFCSLRNNLKERNI